jgi:hypothetical protein
MYTQRGRIEVSEERIASIIRVTRIGELTKMLAITSNTNTLRLKVTANVFLISQIPVTLMMKAIHSSKTSIIITRITQFKILEDGIF